MKSKIKSAFKNAKPYITLVLLLYLIPIVDSIFLFCILAKGFSSYSILIFSMQLVSLISATSASVAASLLFYRNHKEAEKIETNRIIIVVISLSFHLIVEFIFLREDFNIYVKYVLSLLFLFVSIVLLVYVIKYYKSIDDHRKGMDALASQAITDAERKRIKSTRSETVAGQNYNLEG